MKRWSWTAYTISTNCGIAVSALVLEAVGRVVFGRVVVGFVVVAAAAAAAVKLHGFA